MRIQTLINVEENDIRAAILEDGALVELFVESLDARTIVGNLYKGRIDGIIPSLKAVFVDIGTGKNAFMHYNDVLAEYELPERGKPERQRRRPPRDTPETGRGELENNDEFIEPLGESQQEESARKKRPLRVGDEIIVQVTKDEINTKGSRITSYVAMPGRYLVLMPHSNRGGGVSRRIDNPEERKRLRKLLEDIQSLSGSFIIRTAGTKQGEDEIRNDAESLKKRWDTIQKKSSRCRAPALLFEDQHLLGRVVRDNFSPDMDEILVDDLDSMRELIESCREMVPELCERIHYYDSAINIFDTFEVEKQFQKAVKRKVWLRSGGALVIDETEALVAIDINSGKSVGHEDQDALILQTNLEACRAVARQVRLRDLGGLIVIDFIDMHPRDHENQVIREFRKCLRNDRAKYSISDFSEFGLIEMTRKRVRPSLVSTAFQGCPYCDGSGRILSDAQLWKQLKYDLMAEMEQSLKIESIDITVHTDFKTYLQTKVVDSLSEVAGKYEVELNISDDPRYHHERISITNHFKSTKHDENRKGSTTRKRPNDSPEKKLESTGLANNNAQ
jgi:ribonuclease G